MNTSDKPICFSCVHHKVQKGHPSGYEHFCAASTSSPPSGRKYFPINCSDHSDPAHRPTPLVEALADDTHLSFTEHWDAPKTEDQEVEVTLRVNHGNFQETPDDYGEFQRVMEFEVRDVRLSNGKKCWQKSEVEVVRDAWGDPYTVTLRITYNPEGGKDAE